METLWHMKMVKSCHAQVFLSESWQKGIEDKLVHSTFHTFAAVQPDPHACVGVPIRCMEANESYTRGICQLVFHDR